MPSNVTRILVNDAKMNKFTFSISLQDYNDNKEKKRKLLFSNWQHNLIFVWNVD